MDWFPLYNSVRIAGIATVITFFAGILCAYYIVVPVRYPFSSVSAWGV